MTDETIEPFLFEGEITVRVIDRNGELLFVANDICQALSISTRAEALRALDDDEKRVEKANSDGGTELLV